MPSTAPPPARRNQFRAAAKVDELTVIRLAYCFCQGLSLQAAAHATGLSAKTVRSHYLALRQRLLKPAFNRWHGVHTHLVRVPSPEEEIALRIGYIATLATCAGNETCTRNYRLGNRKRRQCRSCPLATALSDARRGAAYALIDTVHAFYERLGIRGEKDRPPELLFLERLIHTNTVASALEHSRRTTSGLFDPNERTFLSGGTLLDLLLRDLAHRPLGTERRRRTKADSTAASCNT